MDRRAEIEEKRARLAQLRQQRAEKSGKEGKPGAPQRSQSPQREPESGNQPPEPAAEPAAQPELATVTAVLFEFCAPLLYDECVQTDSFQEPQEEPPQQEPPQQEPQQDQPAQPSQSQPAQQTEIQAQQPQSEEPQPQPPTFTEAPADPNDPQLARFLDEAWRAVARISEGLEPRAYAAQNPPLKNQIAAVYAVPPNDARLCVADITWSPFFPDLVAVALAKHPSCAPHSNHPSRIEIWSTSAKSGPEYTLDAQSSIVSVCFSQTNAHCVIAAAYSGQILIYDLREKRYGLRPVLRSSATNGHCFPVVALEAPAASLISCDSDGKVCAWQQDMLALPETVLLGPKVHPLSFLSLAVDPTQFVVGTIDGSLVRGCRVDRVTERAGIAASPFGNHNAPVTCLVGHAGDRIDVAGYFLSAGLDWSVKLWKLSADGVAKGPLVNIALPDAVASVAWCPKHPSLFAVGCQNFLHLYNIVHDADSPVLVHECPLVVAKLTWSPERQLAVGFIDGSMQVFCVAQDVLAADDSDWLRFVELFG